jgi:MoaA/NifB/PqqE/SkfB family radical SAM enzyme
LYERGAYAALRRPDVLLNDVVHSRERASRPTVMRSLPTHVEIEVTNRCNLACIQCLRSRGLKPYALGDMSFDDFGKVLAQFPTALHVSLNGFGEPLMHPRLFDFVDHARRTLPWATIVIYSNGMLLDGARAERAIASGLSEINVSIDAAYPGTYRRVRRGGSLDRVHRNLCELVEMRRRLGQRTPLVGVNFVMLDENEGEVAPFVDQAAEIGVDYVNCVSYATYDWGPRNRRDQASYRAELDEARRRLEERGLHARALPSSDMSWADPDRPFDCSFFWGDTLRVTFRGEVTLGCCTPFKETYSYGNLLETPFREIWNQPLFRYNREQTRAGLAPNTICKACQTRTAEFFPAAGGPRNVVRLPVAPDTDSE